MTIRGCGGTWTTAPIPRDSVARMPQTIAEQMADVTPELLRARESLKWTAGGPQALGAFVAESDLPMAPAVRAAIDDALDRGDTGYLGDELSGRVGMATASFQRDRFGWQVEAEWIGCLPSVLDAFTFTASRLVPADTPIVLPTPAYMPFLVQPGLMNRELRTVAMELVDGRYQLDPARLERALTGGALLIVVNPHNPGGQVATREELQSIAEVVQRTGSTVFADEIHSPVVYPGAEHLPYASISAEAAAHSVTAVSASKGWNLPGLACAQLILTSAEHRRIWREISFVAKHGASPLGAHAAIAAYTAGVAHLDEANRYLDQGRRAFGRILAEQAPRIGYTAPEATYVHWLDLRPVDVDPADVMKRTGVLGTDGSDCGAPGFLRLTLATSTEIIEEIARRIARLDQ